MEPTDPEPCVLLPWDSNFFGFTIARVQADVLREETAGEIDRWCSARGVRCLYFAARSDDAATVRVAERFGYHMADVRMTFDHRMIAPLGATGSNERFSIRPAVRGDLERLRQIAHSSHSDTRFFYDTRFPRHLCHALYETWIQSSFEGFAQHVLVGEDAGIVGGYISCHMNAERHGSIGLMAVDAAHQGKGLGGALVNSALAWFAQQEARQVTVVTQGGNVPAQRLYVRSGFTPRKLELYYHRWYEVG